MTRLSRILTDPFTHLLCRLGWHTPVWTAHTEVTFSETRWVQVSRCLHCGTTPPARGLR